MKNTSHSILISKLTILKKGSLAVLFFCFTNMLLLAQPQVPIFKGKQLNYKSNAHLTESFAAFQTIEFELDKLNAHLRPDNQDILYQAKPTHLQIGNLNIEVELSPVELFTHDFRLIQGNVDKQRVVPMKKNKAFTGFIQGTNHEFRLTLDDNFFTAMIFDGESTTYIEPLYRFVEGAPANQLIIYRAEEVLRSLLPCAHNDTQDKLETLHQEAPQLTKTDKCYQIRLGLAADSDVYNAFNQDATATSNFLAAVFNNIQSLYRFTFGDNVEFVIAGQYVSTTTANDPFTPNSATSDASDLLSHFGTWMTNNGFGTTAIDLGSVWVGRTITLNGSGAAGVANTPGVCESLDRRAQIINYTPNTAAGSYACLAAHETGHNFNANHVPSSTIMNPGCGPTVWDATSITQITNHLNSSSCTSGANALTPCPTPVAAIRGGIAACINQPTTLSDNSQFGATRSWSTPSANVTSGTDKDHVITYNTAGTYTATLNAMNSTGNNSISTSILVTTAPNDICAPTGNAGNSGITRFALANVDNNSTVGSGAKLADFACTQIISLTKSTAYTLKSLNLVSAGYSAYLDYNGDGDFMDSGENIFSFNGSGSGDLTTFNGFPTSFFSFTTPATVTEDKILRFRIIAEGDSNGGGSAINSPCYNPVNGEVEDYGVIFRSAQALAVELTHFSGRQVGSTNELNWITASETNHDYFAIEHATDGLNFKQIATINSLGHSTNPQHYSFTHVQPAKGNNYYRLRAVDQLAKSIFTNTITLHNNATAVAKLYPNPVHQQQFFIENDFGVQESISIQILDLLGQTVYQKSYTPTAATNRLLVNLPADFAKGIYYCQIKSNNAQHTLQFVKL